MKSDKIGRVPDIPPNRRDRNAALPYRDGIIESLRLHLSNVAQGWAGLIGIVSGALAVPFALVNKTVPFWVLVSIAASAFVVAQFLSFHKERERGSEISGALYLLNIVWGGIPENEESNSKISLQPTLLFRNTCRHQVKYELLEHAVTVNGVQDDETFVNRTGWVGAGQEAAFRLPLVSEIPASTEYKAVVSYRFSYSSPRVPRYQHRTSRRVECVISFTPQGVSSVWAFDAAGEEETVRK